MRKNKKIVNLVCYYWLFLQPDPASHSQRKTFTYLFGKLLFYDMIVTHETITYSTLFNKLFYF